MSMRTIDPAIILAAMATLETPPMQPFPPPAAPRSAMRPRRPQFAPMTPAAVTVAA